MNGTMRSRTTILAILAVFALLALALVLAAPALARGGGRGGGGFSRPSGGGGGFSRPSGGGFSRPSTPRTRPGQGPGQGGYRPGQPGTPGYPGNRPGQGGAGTQRPWTGNNNINTGDVNINSNNGGWGYGWGSGAGLALGAAAATGAAISNSGDDYYAPTTVYGTSAPTVVYSLPPSCTTQVVAGTSYMNCGGSYYVPVYQGSSVAYQPVPPPY